jgi:hypothetical protein
MDRYSSTSMHHASSSWLDCVTPKRHKEREFLESVTPDHHELKICVTFVRHTIACWGVNMPIKPDHAFTRLAKMLAGLKERPAGAMIGEAAASDLKDEFRRQNGEAPLSEAQRQAVRRAKIKAELEAKWR